MYRKMKFMEFKIIKFNRLKSCTLFYKRRDYRILFPIKIQKWLQMNLRKKLIILPTSKQFFNCLFKNLDFDFHHKTFLELQIHFLTQNIHMNT